MKVSLSLFSPPISDPDIGEMFCDHLYQCLIPHTHTHTHREEIDCGILDSMHRVWRNLLSEYASSLVSLGIGNISQENTTQEKDPTNRGNTGIPNLT